MNDYCPNCGAILEDFIEGSNMGQRCPSCGWSLVTTYTPPILEDDNEYTITLLAGNDATPAALKAISSLVGVNYVTAKRMVLQAPTTLFVGHAVDILGRRDALRRAGVQIAINPEFPYDKDGQLLDGAFMR